MILTHPKAVAILQATSSESQYPLNFSNLEQMNTDIAAFKEDGRGGFYDREWVRQALEASETRRNGGFAAYEKERFEADWGVKWDGEKGVIDSKDVAESEG